MSETKKMHVTFTSDNRTFEVDCESVFMVLDLGDSWTVCCQHMSIVNLAGALLSDKEGSTRRMLVSAAKLACMMESLNKDDEDDEEDDNAPN